MRNNNDNENKYKTSLVILDKTNIAIFEDFKNIF